LWKNILHGHQGIVKRCTTTENRMRHLLSIRLGILQAACCSETGSAKNVSNSDHDKEHSENQNPSEGLDQQRTLD